MYHTRHILVPLTLRHALMRHRAYNPLSFREFSATPRAQASVDNEDGFMSKFKHTSIFEKLADKPEALSAIEAFAKVLQRQGMSGIEMSTEMPSTITMMRLATNKEFRDAAKKVVIEMKNAGVDLSSGETMQEIMKMQKGNTGRDSSS